MALKKVKKFKNTSTTSEFAEVGPISGGNTFDTYNKLQMQEQIDKAGFVEDDLRVVSNELKIHAKKFITNRVPNWWVLLNEQANYFCNQFNWKIDDTHLRTLIINVIRGAFYNGVSGIYYNDVTEDYEAVIVSNIEYDSSSRIKSAKYILAHNYLAGIKDNNDNSWNALFFIPESKIKNLAIFKWGTEALHAWIRIVPYVMNQHDLMKMLTVQKFAYNKKFVYTCNSPTAAKKELELFFDPENPFIVNAGFGKTHKEIENEFGEVSLDSKSALEFVQFYNESMSIIYKQIGRRENTDTKKERNVSSEVEASQENYDVLLKDVSNQFEIFVDNVNEIFTQHNDSTIELIEDMKGDNENDVSEDISKSDNQAVNSGLF